MIGQNIQNYTITAQLGEGGMGIVYKAGDNTLGREVALKMLHAGMTRQSQVLERFKKEAQVLARLLHPNIAVIYNFIEDNGQYFMVMEYVEGNNLDALAKSHHPLQWQQVVAMFIQALEGLQHAHKKGIFHRDIKPSNLILTPEGTVKLMDFGIARIAGEQRLTQVNRVIGTMEFMAPELIEGKEPSAASDIYATGITMYELLSGRLPFESQSDYLLMQDIMKKKPLHLSTVNPSVPPGLASIVMQALEKKPENRFLSARAFQQALIQAFPDCRDADLATLNNAVNDALATREAASVMMPTQLGSITAEKPTVLQQIDRNILRSRKLPFVLAGIGVLLFLGIALAVTRSHDSKELAGPAKKDSVITSIAATPKPPELITTQSTPVQTSIPIIQPVAADESNSNLQPKKEKRAAEKEKRQKMATVEKPVEPEPKKEPEPAPVAKKAEPKEITLREKLEVELSMRETITKEEDDREQQVSFTVSAPVIYNGVVIVSRGAIARGNIKIGRVLSTVDITSVEAANGRQIALKGRAHRKVKELSTERSYTAILVKGTTLLF